MASTHIQLLNLIVDRAQGLGTPALEHNALSCTLPSFSYPIAQDLEKNLQMGSSKQDVQIISLYTLHNVYYEWFMVQFWELMGPKLRSTEPTG